MQARASLVVLAVAVAVCPLWLSCGSLLCPWLTCCVFFPVPF